MDDLITESTQGRINGTQSGAEEKGKVFTERWAVRTKVNPDQPGQGLREIAFRKIRQQAVGATVVDVCPLLPSAVAGTPQQTTMTPDQVLGECIWGVLGRPRLVFGKPGACMRNDLRPRSPVCRSERFNLSRQLLG